MNKKNWKAYVTYCNDKQKNEFNIIMDDLSEQSYKN